MAVRGSEAVVLEARPHNLVGGQRAGVVHFVFILFYCSSFQRRGKKKRDYNLHAKYVTYEKRDVV